MAKSNLIPFLVIAGVGGLFLAGKAKADEGKTAQPPAQPKTPAQKKLAFDWKKCAKEAASAVVENLANKPELQTTGTLLFLAERFEGVGANEAAACLRAMADETGVIIAEPSPDDACWDLAETAMFTDLLQVKDPKVLLFLANQMELIGLAGPAACLREQAALLGKG